MLRKSFIITTLLACVFACKNIPEEVTVSSVIINMDRVNMIVGESLQLSATVSPTNASEKTVIWSSSKQSVASISESGLVTAIAEGSSTITAFAGGKTATCLISVENASVAVSSITLSQVNAKLTVGETISLVAVVKPDNATDKSIVWTSSAPEVTTVEDGLVKAVGVGSARITASAGDQSAVCEVVVASNTVPVESIELNYDKLTLVEGESKTLIATINPNKATAKSIIWMSSDSSIAVVDESGKVFAQNKGFCYITASCEDFQALCEITVIGKNDASCQYFQCEVLTEGRIRIYIALTEGGPLGSTSRWSDDVKNIEYSVDGGKTWVALNKNNTSTCYLYPGDIVLFRGDNKSYYISQNTTGYKIYHYNFASSSEVNISGNIMSLISSTDFWNEKSLEPMAFMYFFMGLKVRDASALLLPATKLADECYHYMFANCTKLEQPPTLPATEMAENCYSGMFYGCSNLSVAPELPAMSLAEACYSGMFERCSSLKQTPYLPAKQLAKYCYRGMFNKCSNLETIQSLPAEILADYCYAHMFENCSSLINTPTVLPATILARSCYKSMFDGCTKLSIAPELPATELQIECYVGMFYRCSNLRYIKALFLTDPHDIYALDQWVYFVSDNGVFVKNKNAKWTGYIPTGWTIRYE